MTDIATSDDVAELVAAFYRRAIPDPVLGPIFEAAGMDWTEHIPRITAFWERNLLGIEGYSGNVVRAHLRVQDAAPFGRAELDHWLALWEETVDDRFAGPVADHAKARARQAADVIERAIDRGTSGLTIG